MPLKFYQSFDINEKDFEELFCAECTRNGSSVDMLNFCIGCESLLCYQCLQDHTRNEVNLGLPVSENETSSGYKQASESARNNNDFRNKRNNNNYYSKPDHNFHQLSETKYKLLSLKKQLNKCIEHDREASERRLEKIIEDVDIKIAEIKTKVMKFLEDFQSNISDEIKHFHDRMEQVYSEKEKSVQILLAKTEATLISLQNTTVKTYIEDLKDFAEQTIAEAMKVIEDPDNFYADIQNKTTQAEKDNTNTIFEHSMDDFLCEINALGRGSLTADNLKGNHKPVCQFYDVESPTDIAECDINGSCVMSDGTIVLADWNNTNIKRLNKIYQVTDTCDLPGIPWSVCCSGRKEVAVSLHFLQRIQFVSLSGKKMMLKDSFKVKQKCRGLAYGGNKIFVSCGGGGLLEGRGQVQVYKRNGTLLETFKMDSTGNPFFACPQHLTVSMDTSRLHVADKNFGLKAIDLHKKMPIEPHTTAHSTTKAEAKGTCLIDDSNILLCDFILNEVVLHRYTVDSMSSIKTLLDRKDEICNPQSLCYNETNSTLVVTSGNTNLIQVFKMEIN